MTKLGERLIRSARQAREIARGEAEPARVFTPPAIDVAAVRKRTGLSQVKFAQRFGFSPAAGATGSNAGEPPIPRRGRCSR